MHDGPEGSFSVIALWINCCRRILLACQDREDRPPTRQPLRPFMLRSAHSLIRVLSASASDDGIVVAAKPVSTDPAGGRCRKECPKPSHLFLSSVFEGVGRIGAHKWA